MTISRVVTSSPKIKRGMIDTKRKRMRMIKIATVAEVAEFFKVKFFIDLGVKNSYRMTGIEQT